MDCFTDGGPFTLLAPPDDAFSKLPPGTVDSILKNKTAAESESKLWYKPLNLTKSGACICTCITLHTP